MCFSVMVQRDLKILIKQFDCLIDKTTFEKFNKQQELFSETFKAPDEDNRIFPNYFAPVLIEINKQKVLRPMRYRIRPADSREEIPNQFNVFNARKDSLLQRKTWRPFIGAQHGIFPFQSFFEWVERDGKKRLIEFRPKDRSLMWAPCLWDYYKADGEDKAFYSFAIITDEPNPEVEEAGHDRTPIFLKEDKIANWLSCKDSSQAMEILSFKENAFYENQLQPLKEKNDSQLKLL